MLLNPTPAPSLSNPVYVYPPQHATLAALMANAPQTIYARLTLPHAGTMTIRPLPVPPTVLHWSQLK